VVEQAATSQQAHLQHVHDSDGSSQGHSTCSTWCAA
jgi:hypothetical protein